MKNPGGCKSPRKAYELSAFQLVNVLVLIISNYSVNYLGYSVTYPIVSTCILARDLIGATPQLRFREDRLGLRLGPFGMEAHSPNN